jgi:hypothetical protein
MPEVTGSGGSLAAAFRDALAKASLGRARPSYRARSPRAQYRQLSRTATGRRALEQAGVTGTRRTQAAWLAGARSPSKANAAAIGRAHEAMRRGGIPDWVKSGEMRVTGRTRTGRDDRDRGDRNPLRINLDHADDNMPSRPALHTPPAEGDSYWDHFERMLAGEPDDDELEDLISEDLIEPDIGSSDGWDFPGGAYSVVLAG